MTKNETPNPRDLGDTKRRVELVKTLALLGNLIDKDTLMVLQRWSISGDYIRIYERLILHWKTSEVKNEKISQAILMAGLGAGFTHEKIRQDMQ